MLTSLMPVRSPFFSASHTFGYLLIRTWMMDADEAEYAEQDSKVKKNLGDRISAWIFD